MADIAIKIGGESKTFTGLSQIIVPTVSGGTAVYVLDAGGAKKLPPPVLHDLSSGGDCVFSFPNDTNADYYIFYSNGKLIPSGYWRPALTGGMYTITVPASYFKDGSYAITGQAIAPVNSSYQDSDISNPIIYSKGITASGFPIEVSTAAEMDEALSGATTADVGKMYKYTGATTAQYKQNELYVITDETSVQ